MDKRSAQEFHNNSQKIAKYFSKQPYSFVQHNGKMVYIDHNGDYCTFRPYSVPSDAFKAACALMKEDAGIKCETSMKRTNDIYHYIFAIFYNKELIAFSDNRYYTYAICDTIIGYIKTKELETQ